jgi:HSP20 family protein
MLRMDPFTFLQNRMNLLWKEFDRDFAPMLQRIAGRDSNPQMITEGGPIETGGQLMSPVSSSWLPAIRLDVRETPQEILVAADLPGVPKESIRASVDENGLLHIRAEKQEERSSNEKEGQWTWRERHSGLVQRSIQLPRTVDSGTAAHAEFKDGVLQMKFNKRPEKLGQPIKIE